jgi:hypothetical protein
MFVALLMVTSLVLNLLQYDNIMNVVIVGTNCVMPFILAALHDWTSLRLMFGSFIQYILLLPTFTAYLSIYAFSRMWELTWGNRPSDKLHTMTKRKTEAELAEIKENLLTNAQGVAWGLVVLNIALTAMFYKMQEYTLFITVLQIFIFSWSTFQMLLSLVYFIYKGIAKAMSWCGRCCVMGTTSQKKLDLWKKFKKDKEHTTHIRRITAEMQVTPA